MQQKKKQVLPKKIKVDALAVELNTDVKQLLGILKDLGINAKTKASSIDEESAKIVRELIKGGNEEKKQDLKPEAPAVEVKAEVKKPEQQPDTPQKKTVTIYEPEITVKDLSSKFNMKVSDLIKELMLKGVLANINQRIAFDIASGIASKLGFELIQEEKKTVKEESSADVDQSKLRPRPPVVTIMGHVDHGKTKLLDAIRKTNVIDTEAGGITQHIGAYQVEIKGKQITFLDTPGHEAFTALRARGANATDIVVLVVAADDGVMPQTREAIDHAKASSAPIIVAINKIDKPDANPDRVKQQLSELDLTPEDWGGKTVTVPVSAKQGTGIDHLLEMILLVAEMMDLKADPSCPVKAIVIESFMDKSMGPVATVLIKEGTLRVGDAFYSGITSGKIRALINDKGKRISKAGPAFPVEIIGISDVPKAGDILKVVNSEKEARSIAEKSKELSGEGKSKGKVLSLEDFSMQVKSGEMKTLNLIIKADVHGSLEALVKSLSDLSTGNIKTHIILNSTGNINRSDVMLAKASEAIIIGFGVDFEGETKPLAETEGVDARLYSIIYNVIDDIKLALEGMLEPEYEEVISGHSLIRQLFKFSKVGAIAGCTVTDGKMVRGASVRVKRNGDMIFEGKISSLKRFKDDVKEVNTGMECGITVADFDDFAPDDIIEQFETRVKRKNVKV
ncbi:MAG: translation initiation factor IF-2 [Candidatus Saganbacteria bacterium]|nr:translation initiation factor IF-2 [Candidatus Saganbacteria bacterium]